MSSSKSTIGARSTGDVEEDRPESARSVRQVELDRNTGLRRGELIALKWTGVDLDAAVLRVGRSRVLVDDQIHEVTSKGGKSRVVDIDPGTVALLKAHRRRQRVERMAWGEAWTDTGYVFTRENGTEIHPDNVSSRLQDASNTRSRSLMAG